MRDESRTDADRIRAAYERARVLAFASREALSKAITAGVLRQLPDNATLFNVSPRLRGRWPIGEKDLAHQRLYVAAHSAALGCLLHVAARVETPLEVTSLVRHIAYQRALEQTNANARTRLAMHTLGLAVDISTRNMTLESALELREVLRHMRDDGDLFVIAETRQLVFHVVPTPERLTYYSDLFEGLLLAQTARGDGWR